MLKDISPNTDQSLHHASLLRHILIGLEMHSDAKKTVDVALVPSEMICAKICERTFALNLDELIVCAT
ncbi:hypothetical protein RPE78_00105 [Thioclava litoralis]|uniref:Uncharacterized protein n=1 Tax=Thioclava litoralis TaxID=3076557 RepID=A0ABZ1DZT4_9RHOB|nr:hypothetical protein RPE78_00105 [Thioclava sp. FTW29]